MVSKAKGHLQTIKMKKGQTESYSFLIGVIITILILTGIGCAVYQFYKPKGQDSFDKLTKLLEDLEKKEIGEGEMPFYVEKDEFIVGFSRTQDAFKYSPDCPSGFFKSSWGTSWGCYGIEFLRPKEYVSLWALPLWKSAKGEKSMQILRPKEKCPLGKSCLCLCKIDQPKKQYSIISEKACLTNIKCVSFDSIDFTGGKGCCEGTFIPGTSIKGLGLPEPEERGIKTLKYRKVGSEVSLDDEETSISIIEKNLIPNLIERFRTCSESNKTSCICDEIDLQGIPEDYKIQIKSEKSSLEFSLYDKENKKVEIEKKDYKFDKKTGLICYEREDKEYKKEFNGCKAIHLTSEKIEFTGECCSSSGEWKNAKKLYLVKEAGGLYLATKEKEKYPACS